MKYFFSILLCLLILISCSRNNYNSAANLEGKINDINTRVNYHSYLDELIELKEKYPETEKRTIVFPIKIYEVEPLLGTSLIENDYSKFIAYLNKEFQSVNIKFELEEVVAFNNSASIDMLYFNPKFERYYTYEHYNTNSINLYVFNGHENVIGFTHYPNKNIQRIYISKEKLIDPSMIHEFGHYFGLLHTFEDSNKNGTDLTCTNSGDKICDTPKDYDDPRFIEEDCVLSSDFYKEASEKLNPDFTNFMSYYGTCRTGFSPMQKDLMYFIAKKIKYKQLRTKA